MSPIPPKKLETSQAVEAGVEMGVEDLLDWGSRFNCLSVPSQMHGEPLVKSAW